MNFMNYIVPFCHYIRNTENTFMTGVRSVPSMALPQIVSGEVIVYFFVFSLAHLLFLPFLIVIFHSYYYSHIFLYYGDMLPPLKSLILKWGFLLNGSTEPSIYKLSSRAPRFFYPDTGMFSYYLIVRIRTVYAVNVEG